MKRGPVVAVLIAIILPAFALTAPAAKNGWGADHGPRKFGETIDTRSGERRFSRSFVLSDYFSFFAVSCGPVGIRSM